VESLFAPPMGWDGENMTHFEPEQFQRYELKVEPRLMWYVVTQLAINVVLTSLFIYNFEAWQPWQRILAAAWLIAALLAPAGLMERKPWAIGLEAVRWIAAPVVLWLLLSSFSGL
jgi:hypothetical protein